MTFDNYLHLLLAITHTRLHLPQLMRGTSADLRFRMLDAYTTCNSLQSIKVEACQMSYDDVDVVIQELDARLKEYEDRVREEIGLVLTPDDMVGVKANRAYFRALIIFSLFLM